MARDRAPRLAEERRRASGLPVGPALPARHGVFRGEAAPERHVRGFEVVSGARGPDLGSDHYPVLARLAPR
jgi:hypothetical protein